VPILTEHQKQNVVVEPLEQDDIQPEEPLAGGDDFGTFGSPQDVQAHLLKQG
jgi:hypothetical protein